MSEKTAYICGSLTDLDPSQEQSVKQFYERIATTYCAVTGVEAFVPHQHYDPDKHPSFTPEQVDEAERRQICELTTIVIAVANLPSWGGGIEIEMANNAGVRVILIHEHGRKVSRLLRGNPAVKGVITYEFENDAIIKLREKLESLFPSQLSEKAY